MDDGDRNHWPALDGLRGIAILVVLAFHVAPDLFVAGSWGVTLFFVLSGFLITTILCREKDATGAISFSAFFSKRALRLLPALVLVLGFYLLVAGPWSMAWPTAAFIANVPLTMGEPVGLGHTWSLAVEEHFYLVWPFLIAYLPKRRRLLVIGVATLAALAWRVHLLLGPHEWERIYYATDTNAFAILAGCLLSVIVMEKRLPRMRHAAWTVAALVLATMIPAFVTTSDTYLWGTFAVVTLSVVAVHQATLGMRLLEVRTLRWLGKVSYGLYLWHNVLIHLPWPGPDLIVGVGASFAFTWLSWRAVEAPSLRLKRKFRPDAHVPVLQEAPAR